MIATRYRRTASTLLTAASFLAVACGKDDPSGPQLVATSLVAETPRSISAPVGTLIPVGGSVVVRDQNDKPLAGVTVTFTPAAGSGTVETPTTKTNGRGVASSGKWTLGTGSGSQRLVARVAKLDSVEFTAVAAPGAPADVVAASVATPSAPVAAALETPPALIVRDQYGNPVAGVPVTFAVRTGGGAATGLTTVSDEHGMASVGAWTLGVRSGPQTLRAQVGDLPEFVLTVNAVAGAIEIMRVVSGIDGIGEVSRRLSDAPQVLARDRYGNPAAGRTLHLRIAQGGGTVSGDVVTDDAGLAFINTWALGAAEGLNAVIVDADGLPPLTIFAKAVPVSSFDIEFRYLAEVTESQRAAFARAAARWRKVIVGDLQSVVASRSSYCGLQGTALNETIDDLIIFVQLVPIDGVGKVLGSAGPCSIRSTNGLALVGAMRFDVADVAELESDGSFDTVVLHEIGHILGIGTAWDFHGLLIDGGGTDPHYIGESGLAGFALAGGAAYRGTPVPVENSGGSGTRDSHWRESTLLAELMTGYIERPGTPMPLSLLTIGALEDIGYAITTWGDDAYAYTAGAAGLSEPPRPGSTDRALREVPFPEPEVTTPAGRRTTLAMRTVAPPVQGRRMTRVEPRPVQQLEVRRIR